MQTKTTPETWCGSTPSEEALERAKAVRFFLMDVDGTMTDGKSYFLPDGDGIFETKGFEAVDGFAFHLLNAAKITTGALSGRSSKAVQERAKNFKFTYLYEGVLIKEPTFEEILKKAQLKDEQVAYIGDDLSDVPLLKRVGLACAVGDGRPEPKSFAHFITTAQGGNGAVREVAELILKAQGKWHEALATLGITL